MATQVIPDEDFHLIEELLFTLSSTEVAEKWEVCRETLRKYLLRFNTSPRAIRTTYVKKYYDIERAKTPPTKINVIAKQLGIAPDNLNKTLKRFELL